MPQTLMEKYGLNKEQLFLIVLLLGFFVYLNQSTQLVPNLVNDTVLYPESEITLAPKNYVSGTEVFIGWAISIVLIFSLVSTRSKNVRITERQFKEKITKEITIKQTQPLPNGKYELPEGDFIIDKNIFTLKEERDGINKAVQYIAQVMIRERDGSDNIYLVLGDVMNGMIDDIIQTDEPLEYGDKCPDCGGRFPNRELILEKSLEHYKNIKKALASD